MAVKATTTTPAAAKKPPAKATAKGVPGQTAARPAATSAGPKGTAPATSKPAPAATVTLKHLSAGLAEKHEMDKKQADTVVADVFKMLVAHLKSGDRLRIGGLGILEVKNRPAAWGAIRQLAQPFRYRPARRSLSGPQRSSRTPFEGWGPPGA